MRAIVENLRGGRNALLAELKGIMSRPQTRSIVEFCLFETAFYFAYRYGMVFSQSTAAPFWFPDSVLLCALLLTRRERWWIFVLGALPIRLGATVSHGIPWWFLLGTFAIDSGKGVLAATLLRRFIPNPLRLETVLDFKKYALIAVLLIPAAGAFGGAAMRHVLGAAYWAAWWQWFLGNVLTQLVVTPTILYWIVDAPKKIRTFSAKNWMEAGLVATVLILVGPFVLGTGLESRAFPESPSYASLLFLAWAAIRFGMFGATGAMAIVTAISINDVVAGRGTFAAKSPVDTAAALQHLLLLQAVPLYVVGILIEQRNGIERTLRDSEKLFRTMADTAPVFIWMCGVDKLCEFVNQGWLDFRGTTMEQELGGGWADGIHPDDAERCLRDTFAAFDARVPFEMEYRMLRHDGEYRWILDKGVPRYAPNGDYIGFIGSVTDISDRREWEVALYESEQRYREVVESQIDLVCRYRPDVTLTLTFVNEAFCKFFRKNREELIGKSLLKFIPTGRGDLAPQSLLSTPQQASSVTFDCEVMWAEGKRRWHHWNIYPVLDVNGRVVEIQAIARDVTERHEAEASLRAMHLQLNQLTSQLIHAQEEERKRIARELHDDFNQQLAAHAIGLANLQRQMPPGEGAIWKRIERLHDQAVHLGDQIRLIAHQLHSPPLNGGIDSTLHPLCEEFSELTQLKVDLRVTGKGRVPADVVSCCYHVVQEALQNIHKHARATSVQVSVQLMAERVVLLVADDGTGAPTDRQKSSIGMGMASMAERVKLLSGEFQFGKRENGGMLIAAEIPFV